MHQTSFLEKENQEVYLYSEIEKINDSMNRRSRGIFALLTEMQEQILEMKKKEG